MDDDLYQDVHSFGEVARTSHDKHQDHTKGWEKISRRGTALGLGLLVHTCRWRRGICIGSDYTLLANADLTLLMYVQRGPNIRTWQR
jgi:hypothetical protein